MDAAMIQRFMRELGLHPYIRRFKSEAGYTTDPSRPGPVAVPFPNMVERIDDACSCLAHNQSYKLSAADTPSFMTPFMELSTALSGAGWIERVRKSSRLPGSSITGCFFLIPQEAGPETPIVDVLGDE
jgi:hypothetical protein